MSQAGQQDAVPSPRVPTLPGPSPPRTPASAASISFPASRGLAPGLPGAIYWLLPFLRRPPCHPTVPYLNHILQGQEKQGIPEPTQLFCLSLYSRLF